MVKPVLENLETDDILLESLTDSPYTGKLIRIGNAEGFGMGVHSAVALEWNGKQLYMLADHDTYRDAAQYLFTLDENTGIAQFVN